MEDRVIELTRHLLSVFFALIGLLCAYASWLNLRDGAMQGSTIAIQAGIFWAILAGVVQP